MAGGNEVSQYSGCLEVRPGDTFTNGAGWFNARIEDRAIVWINVPKIHVRDFQDYSQLGDFQDYSQLCSRVHIMSGAELGSPTYKSCTLNPCAISLNSTKKF